MHFFKRISIGVFKFRLRSLFLLTLVGALALSAWRAWVEPWRQNQRAIQVVRNLGGNYHITRNRACFSSLLGIDNAEVVYVNLADCDSPSRYIREISHLPGLQTLCVGGEDFNEAELKQLRRVRSLKNLILDSTRVKNRAIEQLQRHMPELQIYKSQRRAIAKIRAAIAKSQWARLNENIATELDTVRDRFPIFLNEKFFENATYLEVPNRMSRRDYLCIQQLTTLKSLFCPFITDDALQYIRNLPGLHILKISSDGVTGVGFAHMEQMPNLRTLDLHGSGVVDAGLAHLTKFPNITELKLGRTLVGDNTFKYASKLGHLRRLDLRATNIGNAGLSRLKGLNKLRKLDLCETTITNDGLVHLQRLKNLRFVQCTDTEVTEEGALALEKVIPNCIVTARHQELAAFDPQTNVRVYFEAIDKGKLLRDDGDRPGYVKLARSKLTFKNAPSFVYGLAHNPKNREEMLNEGVWLVLFYAPWRFDDYRKHIFQAIRCLKKYQGKIRFGVRPLESIADVRKLHPDYEGPPFGGLLWLILRDGKAVKGVVNPWITPEELTAFIDENIANPLAR